MAQVCVKIDGTSNARDLNELLNWFGNKSILKEKDVVCADFSSIDDFEHKVEQMLIGAENDLRETRNDSSAQSEYAHRRRVFEVALNDIRKLK